MKRYVKYINCLTLSGNEFKRFGEYSKPRLPFGTVFKELVSQTVTTFAANNLKKREKALNQSNEQKVEWGQTWCECERMNGEINDPNETGITMALNSTADQRAIEVTIDYHKTHTFRAFLLTYPAPISGLRVTLLGSRVSEKEGHGLWCSNLVTDENNWWLHSEQT